MGGAEARDYLLTPMRKADLAVLDEVLDRVAGAVEMVLTAGVSAAMNEFNRRERNSLGGVVRKRQRGRARMA